MSESRDKIVFIVFFNGPPLGVAVYSKSLLRHLVPRIISLGSDAEVICSSAAHRFLYGQPGIEQHAIKQKLLDRTVSRILYLYFFPLLSLKKNVAVVHLTNPIVGPFRMFSKNLTNIVVVHDLNEFEARNKYGFWRSLFRRLFLKASILCARKVICISPFAKNQAQQFLGVIRCDVVLNGAGNDLTVLKRAPQKIILVVGRIDPCGKNLWVAWQFLAKWLDEDQFLQVVFVGGVNESTKDEADEFINTVSAHQRVRFDGMVSDAELSVRYATAEFLFFMSVLEGFGMPPFEALRASCPVVANRRNQLLQQLLGESVVTVDPEDTSISLATIRSKITRLENNQHLAEVSARYSWDEAASGYLRIIYESLHRT